MNKPELRKELLEKRNSLSRTEVLAASESIIKEIENLIKKTGKITILGFMPLGNEIDLRPLFLKILIGYYKDKYDADITLGLPRVCGKEMRFFKINSLDSLVKSKFGIMEPDLNSEEIIAENAHVLVPLIGLNKYKQRLGFGGGFYDKYFGLHRNNILYGLAYDFQIDIDFVAEEHDILMDHIIVAEVRA